MIFLILAPFAAFALLMLVTSAKVSLFVAAAICLAVIALDMWRGRSIKILGAGSAALFAGLGAYIALIDPALGTSAIKLSVDVGVLAISLVSLIVGKPFVLQYALEAVDAETAKQPGFLKAVPPHHLGLERRLRADDRRECAGDLRAEPAAVVQHRDRFRRPQQRRLFHVMVSAISQGEVCCVTGECPSRCQVSPLEQAPSAREQSR